MDEQRAWIRSRRKNRLRITAVILSISLLVMTCPDILATFSALATEWGDGTTYVSGFGELPEAVRAQTVPLGTGEEELSLPDTLEAFVTVSGDADEEGADKPGDAEEGKENRPETPEGEEENQPEDGTGDPGEGTGDAGSLDGGNGDTGESVGETGNAGNPDEGTDSGSGNTGNSDNGTGGSAESGGGNDESVKVGEETDGGSNDGGNADEENSGAGEPDGGSSGSEPETRNDSAPADDEGGAEDADETAKGVDGALTVQRGVFVMPVYMAESVATAEPQTMERKEKSVMIKGVTWQSGPAYDGNVEGTYVFTAVLPEGYALAEGVSLPQITVTVQAVGMDAAVQELLARIAALPEAEVYLADEPDVEEEEEYEAWMDELSAYVAEALDLWEMYEALTEEQRAQIPAEALQKLTAWVEVAEQLAEGIAVTAETETTTITVNLWRNGSKWGGQTIRLRCDGKYYPTEETDTGTYTGTVERGGTCYAYLNDDKSSIGDLGAETDRGVSILTFRYVTVTYRNDGEAGTVLEEESYYCGRVNRNTPRLYPVRTDLSLTKPGYVQTGWSETSGGSGEAVTEITVNQGTGDEAGIRTTPIVLYPVFEPATVTINATNCAPEGIDPNEDGVYETTVGESGDYSVTFKPDTLYNVPAGVTVEIGGTTLGSGDYTYTNGKLTIPRSKITGNVTITAEAEAKPFTITVELLRNGTGWSGQNVTVRRDGVHYPMEETETAGIYKGDYERGGNYFPCLDGKSIGGNYVSTDGNSSASNFHFRYVSVTYKTDGATGTAPKEESYYCGLSTNATKYTVDTTLPLTKPGYVQTGWSETSGGSGEAVTEIIVNKGTGVDGIRTTPIVLYPVFTPATVTINATNCTHDGAAEVGASGEYTVTFTPGDEYHVPKTVTVQIGSTTLGSGEYTYTNGKLTIPRSKITGNITITANASSEHSLIYTADDEADIITESCSNGCGHSATAGFKINIDAPYIYTGSAIQPFGVRYEGTWLGTTKPALSYSFNTYSGTATATLTAGSESVSRTFTIDPKSLEDASVTVALDADSYQYTGKAVEPVVTVRDSAIGTDGRTLAKDTDYTVTYADNTAVGTNTAKVTVTGKGNYTGTCTVNFTIQDKAPDVTLDDLADYSGGNIKLPDDIKDQVEIYDADGKKITPNADGSLPVEPGSTIKIKYPGSDKETVITIPGRPTAPAPKHVTVTGTTAEVSDPLTGEEYALVKSGGTPDWSNAQTDTIFTGLIPNMAYDLYVRKKATDSSFASESAKTQIQTSVTINNPVIEGEGAGKDGNTISGEEPSVDGDSVTYTGTCDKDYTPVIIVDGKPYTPEITWDAEGKTGTWTCEIPVEDYKGEVKVEFNDRADAGLKIEPASLRIYADSTANESAAALLDYVKSNCTVKAAYDNGTSEDVTNGAEYKTQNGFAKTGGTYRYTVEAGGGTEIDAITLTVNPVTAAVSNPDTLTRTKKTGGYTAAEVDTWLPAAVTVTYTGADGYTQRSESRPVTWKTDALGSNFGASNGSQTINGTVTMPEWATGGNTVSIGIKFVDKTVLTENQMSLSVSGWAYGAQTAPAPSGSITVPDAEQTFTYSYRAYNGAVWGDADSLPRSGSGNIIPGTYQVKMTYTGRDYTGEKTGSFTVVQKPLTVEKGTLAVKSRNYDGTTAATLEEGGTPALSGVIANDDVALGGTLNAVFTDKGPKKDISVTVTGFALAGGDAGYYKLVNTTLTLKATINNADGSSPSSGSSSGSGSGGNSNSGGSGSSSGGNNGGSGNSGDSGSNSDNSSSTGADGSSGGNSGTGGNNGGTVGNTSDNGGTTGTGSNNGTGGSTDGTDKGGIGKGSTDSGETSGTGKSAGGAGTSGTGKDTSESDIGGAGKGTIGSTGTSGTGKDGAGNGNDSINGTSSGSNGGNNGTGNGDAGAQQAGNGQQTKGVTVQTVQAAADDGRIVVTGETEKPVAIGTLTEDAPGATRLLVGAGTVTVAVVCEDDQYTVGMNDAIAVANAVLTPEQIRLVDSGESLEIRVDIKNISDSIPPQDMETVEKCCETYGKYLPELTRGAYVDISVYMKTGESSWNAVAQTMEPLEIVIGIPEELLGDGREYYIIRAHEGRYTLLNDMDAVPETITIVTDLFSSYVIAYREAAVGADMAGAADTAGGIAKCGLCHICPTFLGICCFIWMAMILVVFFAVALVGLMRRKKIRNKEAVV